MDTEKSGKKRYPPLQAVLMLMLSAAALQASAESVSFDSNINIKTSELPCGITVTSQETTAAAHYKIDAQGDSELLLNGVSNAKVTAEASGGEGCRVTTISLKLNNGEAINNSSALSSTTSDVYFPFDYALGETQAVNAQGETVAGAQIFDKISVQRGYSSSKTHPRESRLIDHPSLFPKDIDYHYHEGKIRWQPSKKIYLGTDNIPLWLGSTYNRIEFDGTDSKKVIFSLVPVLSADPYDKTTGKKSSATLSSDDVFSNTSVFTVTTI
ncbi:hypothetical protein [Serratia ficaria]|uniref:hypothetical protein n=1 Tax=Serratia ficaria TaxID=61651 RepID=UPI0021792F04|nr:hypothetical protein [Serratia ficaria]CAI1507837.1 Uncharacterised protein [Serratia ficaria]